MVGNFTNPDNYPAASYLKGTPETTYNVKTNGQYNYGEESTLSTVEFIVKFGKLITPTKFRKGVIA